MPPRLRITALAKCVRRQHKLNTKDAALLTKLASAVVARRAELGMTRSQLAIHIGISYGQLSHIENAENWPTVPVYRRLCLALKCKAAPLL